MSKYLNPKVDLTFKKVFGEHPNLVKSLLNALLPLPEGMEIVSVEYLTNETIPDNPAKKTIYCGCPLHRQLWAGLHRGDAVALER